MRVVLLSDRLPPEHRGGAETVVWVLACGLRRAGHDVHIIAGTAGADKFEVRDDVKVHLLHTQPVDFIRSWQTLYNPHPVRAIRKLLHEIQPDIVHAHNIHNHLSFGALAIAQQQEVATAFTAHDFMTFTYSKLTYGLERHGCAPPSASKFRLPLLYNLRLMHLRHNPFRSLVIKRVLSRVSCRMAVSEVQRIALQANLNLNFEVVFNGIKVPTSKPSEGLVNQLKARWGIVDKQVILFSGRFTREKGSTQILAALNQLRTNDPNVVLLLLTNTPMQAPDGVIVGGWLAGDELAAAYQAADVVVAPSICVETFGMVALEAMAARKPVIASCFGGTAEIALNGETGYTLNPYETATFAQRLRQLLDDPSLRQQMGEAGYHRLITCFTVDHQVERTLKLYHSIINRG